MPDSFFAVWAFFCNFASCYVEPYPFAHINKYARFHF